MHSYLAFFLSEPVSLKINRLLSFKENPETLGEHLKKRRFALGLFQRQVAESFGVRVETYLGWEKHGRIPTSRYVGKVIAWLWYDPFPEPQTFGMSQRELAVHLGIDPSTVAAWEKRKKVPRIKRKMADEFLSL